MAVWNFVCQECGHKKRLLVDNAPVQVPTCPKCPTKPELVRDCQPPSVLNKERLDNGIMSRAVERFTDAEIIAKNRKPPKGPVE